MAVAIRAGTEADLLVLRELSVAFEAWLNAIDGSTESVDPARFDPFAGLVFGENRLCDVLVAEVDGAVVGYLVYYFGVWAGNDIAPCVHVADIFVREDHQRGGLGRALMECVRDVGRERGARTVFWTVWRKNLAGQEFYRRLGAEVFDEEVFMRWPVAR
jgi:GNAT superfamily N-acetyltransferase